MNERENVRHRADAAFQKIKDLQMLDGLYSVDRLADRSTPTDEIRAFATSLRLGSNSLLRLAEELFRVANFYDGTREAEDIAARAVANNPEMFEREP